MGNEGEIPKEHKEAFGDGRFIHHLDGGDGFTGVNSSDYSL